MHQRYLFLYSGAIGEATLGMQLGRVLAANVPGAFLEVVSTRPNTFVRELARELPFIRYRELVKTEIRSWLALPGLMVLPCKSVVYEPVTVELPLWWRIVLWCARRRKGSVQIRYQMHGHERNVPSDVNRLAYVCQNENLFMTSAKVLAAWGVIVEHLPAPSLPSRPSPIKEPYLLFHFFAGNYRRSIPVAHAHDLLVKARIEFPNHVFVVTCAAKEKESAKRMCEGVENVRIESELKASDALALLSGADMVVGTASGIIFIAAQIGVPTVAMSTLVDPCWLPTYSSSVTILAARDECRCNGDKTGDCSVSTEEGDVFRCLYYISTEEILAAMRTRENEQNDINL